MNLCPGVLLSLYFQTIEHLVLEVGGEGGEPGAGHIHLVHITHISQSNILQYGTSLTVTTRYVYTVFILSFGDVWQFK